MMQNKCRIIGGQWRSRQLYFVDVPQLRPTPARVRETLFNWLQYDVIGSVCLDLYAGSGALGFEAASRGAKSVVQIEQNAQAYQALQNNARLLNAEQVLQLQTHALDYLASAKRQFDIVFLDPPFHQNLIPLSCHALEAHACLNVGAKVYLEAEKDCVLTALPKNWQLLKQKTAGDVAYALWVRTHELE